MDFLLAVLVIGTFGLAVGAVGIYFAIRERRETRNQRAARDAAASREAHA